MNPATSAATTHAPMAMGGLDRFGRISRLAHRLVDMPLAWVIDEAEERVYDFAATSASVGAGSSSAEALRHIGGELPMRIIRRNAAGVSERERSVLDTIGVQTLICHRIDDGDCTARPLGTLFLADHRRRRFTARQLESVSDLAGTVGAEMKLGSRGTTDALTGLTNRAGFFPVAEAILRLCADHRAGTELLYFDLDGFKQINDTLGHAIGDEALKAFAVALRSSFRSTDVVARLGGDEFVVLALAPRDPLIEPLLERLGQAIDRHNATTATYRLRFSVGSASCTPGRSVDVAALLAEADQAMYRHKQARRMGVPPRATT